LVDGITFENCDSLLAGGSGLSDLSAYSKNVVWHSGKIAGNVSSGIYDTASYLTVSDVPIGNVAGVGSGNGTGITLLSPADYVNIHDVSQLASNTTPVTNSAAGAHTRIHDNPGYNPIGTTAATSTGATGSTITAGNSPETHYIKQSATFNAAVAKNGNAICTVPSATIACVIQLGPNETYTVTWTTTQPTYTKDVH
jgi:hypothetical protein